MENMKSAPHHGGYVASPERDEKIKFCAVALEKILAIPGGWEIKEGLFRSIIWAVSEVDGKYTTRFRSKAALEAPSGSVQHEHVFPMKDLWAIVQGRMKPAQLLPLVAACVVTRDEHRKLSAYDRNPDAGFGWHRYIACKISVVDLTTGEVLSASELQKMNAVLDEAFRAARRDL